MTPARIFPIVNLIALLAWLLLVCLPRQRLAVRFASQVVPAILAALYAALVFGRGSAVEGNFNSLEGVARLFRDPSILLAGWVHYLAFDLLVGAWELRDAGRRGIAHWKVLPCLVLTFLLGPVGWLLYLSIRTCSANRVRPDAANPAQGGMTPAEPCD